MILKRSGGIILHYKIGIDVGSTTLKTVILNEKNEIIVVDDQLSITFNRKIKPI